MAEFDLWSNHRDCLDRNGNPKRRYFSEMQAENTVEYLQKTRGIVLRAYKCSLCGYWHLTKKLDLYISHLE
ncbi:MAG: hypothetical protein U0I22_09645 [Treponema sp.]|nr:hypothetical protein [Treponema sp.]MEE0134047.1 hypothetical protein [Treponema sp.]